MKILYSIWTWSKNTEKADFWQEQKWRIEEALREVSYLGYDGIEHFRRVIGYYKDCEEELEKLLNKYGLSFPSIYLHLTGDQEEDLRNALECCEFGKRFNTHLLVVQAPWLEGKTCTPEDVAHLARVSNAVAAAAKEKGMTFCLHPHWDTYIANKNEIEIYEQNVDHELVFYCMDTAHLALCGMDSKEEFKRYAKRIQHVHLKDLDTVPDADTIPPKWFLPPGDGTVDLKGCIAALQTVGYDGYLCVEVDYPRVCNYHAAQCSMRYIRDVLGM